MKERRQLERTGWLRGGRAKAKQGESKGIVVARDSDLFYELHNF